MSKTYFSQLIIGQPASGKTTYVMQLAKKYAQKKGAVLAYNIGKPEDFPDGEYLEIEPIGFYDAARKHLYGKESKADVRTIDYFRFNNKVYHFRDFNKMFHLKKVKCYRMGTGMEENAFAGAIYKYVTNTLFLIDDCRSIFRDGLKKGHIDVFSRSRHCGKMSSVADKFGTGIDNATIWHSADHVNPDFWDYGTNCVLFKFPAVPDFSKLSNPLIEGGILEAKRYLDESPSYHFVEMSIQGAIKQRNFEPLNI